MAAVLWMVAAITLILRATSVVHGAPQVPALFVFGDSLCDPGNNNHLVTLAKANYYPNGIDFAGGVTGRYCNGGTIVDHLGTLLGLPLIPPFNNANTSGSNILKGVNYASAASGILDETGTILGDLFSTNEQVKNFITSTVNELRSLLGNETEAFLANSLFFVATGSNDYITNYLMPFTDKHKKYNSQQFAAFLLGEFRRQLKDLYVFGARKFLIAGLSALGCIPNQIGNSNVTEGCLESTNALASEYNSQLQAMLPELSSELPGSSFLYWDTYDFLHSVINQPSNFGFKYSTKACCGGGRSKGQIMCLPLLPLECRNRSEYIFWDPYHPTDAFNVLSSQSAYKTLQTMNVA